MGDLTKSTQETTASIPGRSSSETAILRLLEQFAKTGAGQSFDLSKLAGGDLSTLGPTGQDEELVRKSVGASKDIAMRELEDVIAQLNAGLSEDLAAKNVQGSSIEAVQKAVISRQGAKSMADLLSQEQKQGAESLMNLPFQRANVALNANQILAQRLIGAGGLSLQSQLQERLAQGSTKQTTKSSPFSALINIGQVAGGF